MKKLLINFYSTAMTLLIVFVVGFASANAYAASDEETTEALQQITVTGTVVDENGDPMPGVNIIVKGTTLGTFTDANGKYTLSVPNTDAVLEFTFIGYAAQEVKLGGRTVVDISMKPESMALEEVVVIGYGTNSKRNLITSVSTVDAEKIKNVPVPNVTDALAGRAAGLIVTQSGGGLGKRSNISIRGGGQPIVVIDGFIVPYQDFVNLNSDDIESMSILKDAASTAVYGARAGDGVIVIKTKNGQEGLNVDYSFNQNWNEPTYLAKKLNSYEGAVFGNKLQEMYKLDPVWTPDEIEKFRTGSDPYNYPNTDWQKLVLKNFASDTRHNISLRGGTEWNNFYASLQVYNQKSLYKTDAEWYKKYTAHINDVANFENIGLKLTFGVDAYIGTMRNPLSAYSSGYHYTWGHIQNCGSGGLAINKEGQYYVGADNPLVEISDQSGYSKIENKMFTGLFNAEWKVTGVKGLKLKVSGNYRYGMDDGKYYNKTAPQYDLNGIKGPDAPVSLQYTTGSHHQYTMQYFADYKRSFADVHNVSATIGFEQTYGFYRGFNAIRKNYVFMIDQLGAGPSSTMENGGSESEFGRAGLITRVSYNYKQKYYLEGSMRHDGSDLFPKDRRWGTFYAGSLGWALSEESFFQPLKNRNILNFFKLRMTYGETGLDSGVGSFSYLTSYRLHERGYVLDGKIVPTFSEGNLISSDITWYTRNTFDIGFDFRSLDSRLNGSFDYFYMKTIGYLTSPSNVNYTDPLGLPLPKVKSDGEHRRAGYEVALSWKDKIENFTYEIGGNFTYFDQLVAVAWNEDLASQKNPYKREVQQTGYYTKGFTNLGYYENSDQTLNLPRRDASSNLVAGDIIYKDMNGDGFINGNDQWRIGKNMFPRGNYGIFANLAYKGISLNCLFQGATNRDLYLDDVVRGANIVGQPVIVYPYQLDYWMPDNRDAVYPRVTVNSFTNGNNNYQTSDFWLVNGRYIRLKSLQLGYDLKHKLLKNIKWLNKCQLVMSGQNLFTISQVTKYGMDPETGSTNNYDYPVMRVYAISLNVGF